MKEIIIGKENPSFEKLTGYGFEKNRDFFELKRCIMDGELCVHLQYVEENKFLLRVSDISSGEEYVLHNVATAKASTLAEFALKSRCLLRMLRGNALIQPRLKKEPLGI